MKNREESIKEKKLLLTPDSDLGKELEILAKGNYEHNITDKVKDSKVFKEMQDVTHLEISGFGQSTNELILAAKIAGTSKTLQAVGLNLGKNNLYLYSWPDVISNLSKAPLLKVLDLSGNEIRYLGSELSYYLTYYMPDLQILNLSNNGIGLFTAESVQQLLKLPHLQVLNISGNTTDQLMIDQIKASVKKYNIDQPLHNESLFQAVNLFVLEEVIIKDIATSILGYHEHPVELII